MNKKIAKKLVKENKLLLLKEGTPIEIYVWNCMDCKRWFDWKPRHRDYCPFCTGELRFYPKKVNYSSYLEELKFTKDFQDEMRKYGYEGYCREDFIKE